MDKDLERLLELRQKYGDDWNEQDYNEFKQLKSKLNEKLEKAEKYDILNEVFENYPKGWLDMKKDLEQQIKQLKEENKQLRLSCNETEAEAVKRGLIVGEKDDKIQSLKSQLEENKERIEGLLELVEIHIQEKDELKSQNEKLQKVIDEINKIVNDMYNPSLMFIDQYRIEQQLLDKLKSILSEAEK
jgi:DNA repair exonuclease SbcCD ATPase subunit